jgi:hypothetical protein
MADSSEPSLDTEAEPRISRVRALNEKDQSTCSLHALTSRELDDYRRELEHSLSVLARRAPVRELLHRKLAEVLAEQEARSQLDQPSEP